MGFSREVSLLLLLLVAFCTVSLAHAKYSLVAGGCYDNPAKQWTLTVSSAESNAEAAAFLAEQGLGYAGLAGSIVGGILYWDDSSAVHWQPASFHPPSSANGFLVLHSDGSWSCVSDSEYFSTPFICTDGQTDMTTHPPVDNTTTTTTTLPPETSTLPPENSTTPPENSTFPPENSTTPPENSTSTTTTTEAPYLPSVPEILSSIAAAMDAIVTFDVAAYASSAVVFDVPPDVVSGLRSLGASSPVFIGFGQCPSESGKMSSVSLLFPTGLSSIGFHLPHEISVASTSATTPFNLCLLGFEVPSPEAAPHTQPVAAHIQVHSFSDILSTLKGTIIITEEDVSGCADRTAKSIQLTGPGTSVPYTTELSPAAYADLSLTLVNNGVVGQRCSPSNLPIRHLVVRGHIVINIPCDYIKRIGSGPKTLCASTQKEINLAIAKFSSLRFAAVAPQSRYTYGTPIPVTVSGLSTNSLAQGLVTAFLSSNTECSARTNAAVAVAVSNTFDPTPPHLYLTASLPPSAGTRYACLQYRKEGREPTIIRLTSGLNAAPVSVAATPSQTPPGKLVVFDGMEGSVSLPTYVTPAASDSDQAHYESIMEILTRSETEYVRFVPLAFSSATTRSEKLAACKGDLQDARIMIQRGIMEVPPTLSLSHSSGILCAGAQYMRIDYVLSDPRTWLLKLGGESNFTRPFILSPQMTSSDAATISFSVPSYGDVAVRFSPDGSCTSGFVSPVIGSSSLNGLIIFPAVAAGAEYTICVGLYSTETATAAFSSSGRTIRLSSYHTALRSLQYLLGASASSWAPCGGSAACGSTTKEGYVQVCGSAPPHAMQMWPRRLADEVNYIGAFDISVGGETKPAGLFFGAMFVPIADAAHHCQQYALLEMASDATSYSTSVVSTLGQPRIAFVPPNSLSGVLFGVAPWDRQCASDHIQYRVMGVHADGMEGAPTSIDLSSLAYRGGLNYYMLCYMVGSSWRTVRSSFVKVSDVATNQIRIEAIGTGNPLDNEARIHIWQTETPAWSLVGQFDQTTSVFLRLVWDDATCQGPSAYSTEVKVLSSTSAVAHVDATRITPAPHVTSQLYPCSDSEGDSNSEPLTFEKHRNRSITITNLTLSSINYLPMYAIAYTTTTNTTIQLTDVNRPPITQLALFVAESPTDVDATANCATTSQNLVAILPTTVNALGLRWVVVPPSVPRNIGSATRDVYMVMCGTAATTPNPSYHPLDAYLVVSSHGMNEESSSVYLQLIYKPTATPSDVIDASSGIEALMSYVVNVVGLDARERILVSEMSPNHYALYVRPGAADDSRPTQEVYETLRQEKGLPLFTQRYDNVSSRFVLYSAEGLVLGTNTIHKDFPRILLPTSTPEKETGGGGAAMSVALFCIVVTPTAVGFVVFSVQRNIPKLTNKMKKTHSTSVYIESGNSPEPRNPQPSAASFGLSAGGAASQGTESYAPRREELTVTPNAEDTAANPLFDDASEDGTEHNADLGASPPVHNETFARKSLAYSKSEEET